MKKLSFYDDRNIISRELKTFRVKNGLSQEGLATKMQLLGADLTRAGISRIEKNTRLVTDYELVCFAKVLGVEIEVLLQDFNQEPKDE